MKHEEMDVRRFLMNILSGLAGLALAASLAGCGYQLRGQDQLPFDSAFVENRAKSQDSWDKWERNERRPTLSSSLAASLRRVLSVQKKLAADAKDAPVRIVLNDESLTKTILALSGGGKVREYRLAYKVTLTVVDAAGKELIAPRISS
jgi:LPS-assembly lipoprotein